MNGEIMELEDMKIAFDGVRPKERRVPDMRFEESSLAAGIVSSAKEQSEVAKEGLRNGDKIMWHSRLVSCMMQYKDKLHLLVDRDGKRVNNEGQEAMK